MAVQFPRFDHAAFLDRAWKDGTPRFNLGSSSLVRRSWQEDGLPALPTDIDSHLVNLRPQDALRDAVASHAGIDPANVTITAGTSAANLAAMLWAYRPGCNFVVERPYYSPLAATAHGVGVEVRFIDRWPTDDWRLDPDAVRRTADDDTALIVLASPNNPTQAAASKDDLRALGEIAEDLDAHVLVDQVYRELTDDPVAAPLHDRLITTAGFNKSWGLPGIRIGWLLARPDLVDDLLTVHMQTVMAPNAVFEEVAVRLLAMADTCRAQMERVLGRTLPLYRDWVEDTRGVDDPAPRHLTAFPSVPVDDTAAFCERIAGEPGVVCVPGKYFGRAGHVRIGLGGDPEKLAEGLAELARLLP